MYTELQQGIKAYLDQQQYDKALTQWELVQKSIEKLSSLEVQEHIRQAHALANHFLATQQATKADDLYERLKKACLQLAQFGLTEQVQFYQAIASNYEAHGKHNEALTYYTQALYLAEQEKQTDLIATFTGKLNQLHHKLLAKLITPCVRQQIEAAKSCLHVAKQRSLEEFTAAANNFLLLANALQQEQQWELTISCYETVVSNAERLAQMYVTQPLIVKITELSRYDRGETKPTELSRWQMYRQQLHALRECFFKQLETQSVISVQAVYSRDLKKLLAEMLKQIESLLGEKPCAFSVVVLGSLAREDACPYSDIDFAVLVSDESKRHDDYFQTLIQLFSLTINLIGEPNGLAIDSGDLGYLTGKDKICLNTPANLAKRFSPAKHQEILDQPETHALHRPAFLYASAGGENLLIDYQKLLRNEWPANRAQWVSGYARLHYESWQVLGKKTNQKSTIDLKEDYLRPLLLWCTDIALRAGIEVVSVDELLQTLATNQVLDADFIKELSLAIEFIQKLRIGLQLKSHAQHEQLDIFKNMNAGLELEKIRSQVLVPAYETLQRFEKQPEKQLEQFDPVTEYVLQIVTPLSNPVAVTALTASTSLALSSSSSSTGGFFSPRAGSTAQLAEQAIQTFIEVVLMRGGAATEQRNKHREIYRKLPAKLRVFYFKQFEAALSASIQAKKLDQKTASYVLYALASYPDSNGLRNSSSQQMPLWENTLLNLTEVTSQNSQSVSVTLEWFNSRGQKEKRVLKPYYVEQLWGSQGKLGGHDKLSDGRRLVRPLQDPSGKLVAYVKAYPELPGIQLSVNSLVQHVSGEGMKSTVVKAITTSKATVTYPLLLSEPVSGKTLQQALREHGNLNEIENNLDPKSFTLKVFESLIINPEDDKADNLVAEPMSEFAGKVCYRIVSVDSDHAYVDPLTHTGTLLNRQEKVQVKSMLYCMEAMLQPLNPEAIQEFLLLDPFQVLSDWLLGLHLYNQRYVGNKELNLSGVFTESEMQNYAEIKDFSFIPIFFEPGWVAGMYEKFLRLQAALRENLPTNHLELLALIEPHLAMYYKKVFAEHKLAHARFQALPTDYVTVAEKQTNTVRYQSTLKTKEKVLRSMTIVDQKKKKDLKTALKEGGMFTPEKAQKVELQMVHERYQQLHAMRSMILRGSIDAFEQIKDGDFFKEKVVNSLDFSQMNEQLAIKLLGSLAGVSFFSLSVQGCRCLTDELLIAILKSSPNLSELDVSDCVQLTTASFVAIAKYCKYIVKITAANIGLEKLELGLGRAIEFASLKKLRLPRCEKLTIVLIDAPVLEEMQLSGCSRLNELKFKSTPPKCLDVQNCPRLEAQKSKAIAELMNVVGELSKLRSLLGCYAYCVNETASNGNTLLEMATMQGEVQAMEFLISVGAIIDKMSREGYMLLQLAIMDVMGSQGMVREAMQSLESKDNYKWNPVVKSVAKSFNTGLSAAYKDLQTRAPNVVRVLLRAGSKVDQQDKDGNILFFVAAQLGKPGVVEVFLQAGASVQQRLNDGSTPLHLAATRGTADQSLTLFGIEIGALDTLRSMGVEGLDKTNNSRVEVQNLLTVAISSHLATKTLTLRALLRAGAKVDQVDSNGMTPLCIMAQQGNVEAVQVLLHAAADVNHTTGDEWSPLLLTTHREIKLLLLHAGAKVDHENKDGSTALSFTAEAGDVEAVKILLAYQANVNRKTLFGTALEIATRNNHTAVVNLLNDFLKDPVAKQKEFRGDVDKQTTVLLARIDKALLTDEEAIRQVDNSLKLVTAVSTLVNKGKVEVLEILLQAGARVDEVDNDGVTPLHVAAREGNIEAVQLLLSKGAKVNQADKLGRTPLYMAAEAGKVDVMQVLLQAKAAVDQANIDGWAPLHIATFNDKTEAMQVLIDARATVDCAMNDRSTPLTIAASHGRIGAMRVLLEAKAKVNQVSKSGVSPLFAASQNNQAEAMRVLLREGAIVDQADAGGWTPFSIASQNGHVEALQILLGVGARVDQRNSAGWTALHHAARKGKTKVLQVLCKALQKAGMTVDLAANDGSTPLHFAAFKGMTEAMQILLNAGANVHQTTNDGATPLWFVAQSDNEKAVQVLLDVGAKVDDGNKNGATPLYMAVLTRKVKAAQMLVDAHATVDQAANDGWTPFLIASQNGDLELMRVLQGAGAKVDQALKDGTAPLHLAAQADKVEAIQLLIKTGAEVDHVTNDGSTPLCNAVVAGNVGAVKRLLDAGAKMDHAVNEGWTPVHMAVMADNVEVLRVLLRAGANVNQAMGNNTLGTPLFVAAIGGRLEAIGVLLEAGAKVDEPTQKILDILEKAVFEAIDTNFSEQLKRLNSFIALYYQKSPEANFYHNLSLADAESLLKKENTGMNRGAFLLCTSEQLNAITLCYKQGTEVHHSVLKFSGNGELTCGGQVFSIQDYFAKYKYQLLSPICVEDFNKVATNSASSVSSSSTTLVAQQSAVAPAPTVAVSTVSAPAVITSASTVVSDVVSVRKNNFAEQLAFLNNCIASHYKKSPTASFYHAFSRDQAENFLKTANHGTFLLRASSQPNALALSYKIAGAVGHVLLEFTSNGELQTEGKNFSMQAYFSSHSAQLISPLSVEDFKNISTKLASPTSSTFYSTANLVTQHNSPVISAPLTTGVVQADAAGEAVIQDASTCGK